MHHINVRKLRECDALQLTPVQNTNKTMASKPHRSKIEKFISNEPFRRSQFAGVNSQEFFWQENFRRSHFGENVL